MKKKKNSAIQCLLLDNGQRPAGSMVNSNGETISWDNAYKLTYLPLEESKANSIRKVTVLESAVDSVDEALAEIHWGALITLSLENGKVSEVTVVSDLLETLFE
jgi:hypothetical protein